MKGEKFMEEILSNGLNIIPNITRRIKNGADLLGLELADHIIIGDNDYFSFREHGYI